MTTTNNKVGYQFTPMPKQLTHLLDVNLRSMLFALVDASNYFADEDGWFFRTNELLKLDSALSKNLVIATIDTLFQHSLVEVSCSGTGRGKQPNNYRLNLDLFEFFEQLDMNTDLHRPENKIETVKYNGSGYHATYLDDEPVRYLPELVKGRIVWNQVNPTATSMPDDITVPTTDVTKELTTNVPKIEHNIDNINSIYNKEYVKNIDNIDSDNNKKSINNILKENYYKDNKELEREMEEGVTEPNSKNENEGKEYPNQSKINNISSSVVQEEESGVDGSSQSQSNDEDPERKEEKYSNNEKSLLTESEEFKRWQEVVTPELDKMKHITSREEFQRKEKNFYQFYNGKVEEIGFINERVKKSMDSHIKDIISTWKYITYCKWR